MSKNNTIKGVVQDILIIMDRSGSMNHMGDEPLQALNEFIKKQQEVLGEDGATLSLWMFDTKTELIIDDKPLKDISPITNYVPNGMTAMYDAIGKAVSLKYSKSKSSNVVCMVITDGMENSSRDFSLEEVKKLIDSSEKDHGWKFIFIGAKDVFAEGEKTGFNRSRCAAYKPSVPGMLSKVSRDVSDTVAMYRCVTSEGVVDTELKLRHNTAPARLNEFQDDGEYTTGDEFEVNIPSLSRMITGVFD